MAIARVQISFPHVSGFGEDTVTNTWHFDAATNPITGDFVDAPNILDMVEDFYTVTPVGDTRNLMSLYNTQLTGDYTIRAYSLDDPSPRPVRATRSGTAPVATTALPEEVALVLSYEAVPAAGIPQARRQGSIFLGPWSVHADVLDQTDGRPRAPLLLLIRRAARDLLAASNASLNNEWVVWSPTSLAASTVANGHVDNAWDTQRRRGVDATVRQTWTASTP